MSPEKGLVTRQSEEYRKGQVLGFTMAEIMLVLLFLLLLLLGAKLHKLTNTLNESYQPGTLEKQSVDVIKDTLETLKIKKLVPENKDVLWLTQQLTLNSENFIEHQMGVPESTQEQIEKLLKQKQELLYENQVLKEMQKGDYSLVDELVAAKEKIDNLQPLEDLFKDRGLTQGQAEQCLLSCGGGPKACWGESLSNPDFIYNVALYDNGFYVSPDLKSIQKNLSDWEALSMLARVSKSEFLDRKMFKRRFSALLKHAKANDCVFQVRLVDQETSSKKVYKSQRSLVEGYVYPTPFKEWKYGTIQLN